MAVPKRRVRAPGTYFVTSRTWESRALFVKEPGCQIFLEALLHYRDEGAYRLHAFVLMPEHFHVLITPASDTTLERALQYIKGGSARRMGEELRLRFPVWQRGFSDHRIRDAEDYETHARYIERNPVKRKLVEFAGEYPWSSASGKFRLDEVPQGLKPREEGVLHRHGLSRALTRHSE
jgi:putative transposase